MKTPRPKLNGAKPVTLRVGRRFVKVGYTRVTLLSSTTLGSIAKVRCETYQFVWSVATQTGFVNHLGIDVHQMVNHYVTHIFK
jgi:hypothetical protein